MWFACLLFIHILKLEPKIFNDDSKKAANELFVFERSFPKNSLLCNEPCLLFFIVCQLSTVVLKLGKNQSYISIIFYQNIFFFKKQLYQGKNYWEGTLKIIHDFRWILRVKFFFSTDNKKINVYIINIRLSVYETNIIVPNQRKNVLLFWKKNYMLITDHNEVILQFNHLFFHNGHTVFLIEIVFERY